MIPKHEVLDFFKWSPSIVDMVVLPYVVLISVVFAWGSAPHDFLNPTLYHENVASRPDNALCMFPTSRKNALLGVIYI